MDENTENADEDCQNELIKTTCECAESARRMMKDAIRTLMVLDPLKCAEIIMENRKELEGLSRVNSLRYLKLQALNGESSTSNKLLEALPKPLSTLNLDERPLSVVERVSVEERGFTEIPEESKNLTCTKPRILPNGIFLLRDWSFTVNGKNMFLHGTKYDETGHCVLQKNHRTRSVAIRMESNIVRTVDGAIYIIDGKPKWPADQSTPTAVMNSCKTGFPYAWRKITMMWLEMKRSGSNRADSSV